MRRALPILLLLFAVALAAPPLLARLGLSGPDAALLPPRGRAVPIGDGLELNVVEEGKGPAVVLVHGLPSNAQDWGAVPERLAQLGYRAVAYDRIGYGYSSRPPDEGDRYTLDSNARDLHRLLDALEIRKAVLVGWSYGGGVVQRFVAEAPERCFGLVLLASVGPLSGQGDSPIDRIAALPFATRILEWLASVPPIGRRMTRDGVANAFSGEEVVPPGWLERTGAMLSLPGTLRALVRETQRFDAKALHPEGLRTPVLVLHGDDDRDVPLAHGEDLHRRISGSELVVVPHGSHMLPATHPDLVAASIHRFAAAHR